MNWLLRWGSPIVFLLILFGLLMGSARQLSFTVDEPSHISAGYAYLARGMAGMWTIPTRGHPLLIDAWIALPLYIVGPSIEVEALEGWQTDRQAYDRALVLAGGILARTEIFSRLPVIWITILLGSLVYRWAADIQGWKAGLVALGMLVFDPTLLAHGCLATNDMGVTFLGGMALYWVWKWCQRPQRYYVILAGIFTGLTILSKGSGVLWAVAGGVAMLWNIRGAKVSPNFKTSQTIAAFLRILIVVERFIFLGWPKGRASAKVRLGLLWQVLVMACISFLVMWAMYGFDIGPVPDWLSVSVPAPMHWRGLLYHSNQAAQNLVFALGQVKHGHWWWYFPVAFLLKNPLPLLFGLLISAIVWIQELDFNRLGFTWLIFSVIYIGVALFQGPNIGYRHLLPVHPFMYLFLASILTRPALLKIKSKQSIALFALVIWYIVGTLGVHPYELTFFNELAGGPEQGWRYLAGSNTDWRQGWKALRTWQRNNNQEFYGPAFRSSMTPKDYGVHTMDLPRLENGEQFIYSPYFPPLGDYIIRAHDLSTYAIPYGKNYAWFRYHPPNAVIANSLYYYHVSSPIEPLWLAQCTAPVVPLDKAAISRGFGDRMLRTLAFDCAHAWIYPYGGRTTGWYAFHDQVLQSRTLRESLYLTESQIAEDFPGKDVAYSMGTHHLAGVPQSFRQWEYRTSPAFALYEWQPEYQTLPVPEVRIGVPARAAEVPLFESDDVLREAPWLFDDTLTLLGVSVVYEKGVGTHEEGVVGVETWWRMDHTEPFTRSFSIMAHLVTEAGQSVAVGDGWGVSPMALRPGDIIVQYHEFKGSLNEAFWLRTGVYWLEAGERWLITGDAPHDAVFIPMWLK